MTEYRMPPLPLEGGDVARSEKPVLCLDFDGVLHSYVTGWKGATEIPDPPVPGFAEFLAAAVMKFRVCVYSSRSSSPAGIKAMQRWLYDALAQAADPRTAAVLFDMIDFPKTKPPAFLTIDDRALTFTGTWPAVDELVNFRPWYRRPPTEEEA
jgi:hypothetical protein